MTQHQPPMYPSNHPKGSECPLALHLSLTLPFRNSLTVGVAAREVEGPVQLGNEDVAQNVLDGFRVVMDVIRSHSSAVGQVELPEAMAANDSLGGLDACRGKLQKALFQRCFGVKDVHQALFLKGFSSMPSIARAQVIR